MIVRSIRRLTDDCFHNAFTGTEWFQGALYVGYRHGDGHVCHQGRLVVLRSRDGGVRFDIATVARGGADTRDAHLYAVEDRRLHLVGCVVKKHFTPTGVSGTSWTENGLDWSPWMPYTGTGNWWMWHPAYFNGRHYCAAYGKNPRNGLQALAWFESQDGIDWQLQRILCEGMSVSEASLDFKRDGSAAMLVRQSDRLNKPLLMRAQPPYAEWTQTELDIPMNNPTLWFVDDEMYVGGRWSPRPGGGHQAQLALFQIVDERPVLQFVMPSGPTYDCAYLSVAQRPDNRHRFAMAYYSGHVTPADPELNPWNHPDIYLADVVFNAPFITRWQVSDVVPLACGLSDAALPDPVTDNLGWCEMSTWPGESEYAPLGSFVDAHEHIAGRSGVVYFVADFEAGGAESGRLYLGNDGPIRVWVNGEHVFQGPGRQPAKVDEHTVPICSHPGHNRVVIAMDTEGGKAWGVMARFEASHNAPPIPHFETQS